MMYGLLLAIQVVVAVALIVLIMLQHGKGADAGAAFGSGASATVFGARGSANFLSRSTAGLAVVFFINSLTLAYLAASVPETRSLIEQMQQEFRQDRTIEEFIPLLDAPPSGPGEIPR